MAKPQARLDITREPPILINDSQCDLCGACVGICPPDVIVMTDRTLKITPGCIKCGLCIPACPLAALGWNEGPDVGGNGRG